MKDTFAGSVSAHIRVADVDYSVPPGLSGRRVHVRLSLTDVAVHHESEVIAQHIRSNVPADVVLNSAQARALRLQCNPTRRHTAGDAVVPVADLSRYDALVGLA